MRRTALYGVCFSPLFAVVSAALNFGAVASAETLSDALSLAYQSNPTLQQARAQLRALDESEVQARAGWRPTVGVSASDDYEDVLQKPTTSANSGGATLNISQALYTSGKTGAAVRASVASIEAGRENLRATEASVLLSVIQAYEDVLRDQTIYEVRKDDLTALQRVFDEVSAKRQVGQITRTDVLQIKSQVASAQAALSAAAAQLQNSRAEYAASVGQNPGELQPPPTLPEIPKDVDAAFDIAEAENPVLKGAKYTEQSSREKIAEAKALNGPTISLGAQVGYSGSETPAQTVDYSKAVTAQVVLTQPLFAGGQNDSQIRQAIQLNEADRIGVEKARRQVVQQVAQAWNEMISNARVKRSDEDAFDNAKLELEGMQEEYKVALRSTLEVLSADDALRAAQVNLATAEHDGYIAQAELLLSVGKLEAGNVLKGEPQYDPVRNYRHVRNKGATPYEFLIAGLDGVSIGHVGALPPVETPKTPQAPLSVAPETPPDPDAPLATQSPTVDPNAGAPPKADPKKKAASRTASRPQLAEAPASPPPPSLTPLPPSASGSMPAPEALPPAVAAPSTGSVALAAAPIPPASAPAAPETVAVVTDEPTRPKASAPLRVAKASPPPLVFRKTLSTDTGASSRAAPSAGPRPGGLAVQIGAFGSRALAEASWSDIRSSAPSLARGLKISVEPVSSDGTTLYRTVVTGFDAHKEAMRFCDALKAQGRACFIRAG